jgi:hypothetical protein
MAQTLKVSGVATSIRAEGGRTIVRYHNTDVVSFDSSLIDLNTGGWKTATTKLRMNQAAAQFALGFYVSQSRGEWWVYPRDGDRIPFTGSRLILVREGLSSKPYGPACTV